MSDPSRLCDDAATDAFERSLLRSATLDREPADGAARALAALGVATTAVGIGKAGASVSSMSSAAGGTSTIAAGTSVAAKIGGITLIATGSIVGPLIALQPSVSAPKAEQSVASVARVPSGTPMRPVAVVSPSSAPTTPDLPIVTVTDLPSADPTTTAPSSRSTRVGGPRTERRTARGPRAGISEEIAIIDQARTKMTAGDTAKAARLLDVYDAQYGNGALVLEARIARIELLIAMSEDTQARDLCERFLREHPQTAYDRRVRALLRRVRSEPAISK